MGYAAPQQDNEYKVDRPTPRATEQPAAITAFTDLAPLSEFEDMLTPGRIDPGFEGPSPEGVFDIPAPAGGQGEGDPIYSVFGSPTLTPTGASQTLGGGDRQIRPAVNDGGLGDNPDENQTSVVDDLNSAARGLNDFFGTNPENYTGRGGPDRGGDINPNSPTIRRNANDYDSGYELARRMDEAGYGPGDINLMEGPHSDGMAAYWAEKDKADGGDGGGGGPELDPTDVEQAVASGDENWINFKGDTLPGLKEGYEVAYNKETGEYYIKNWNVDNPETTWERWDGEDVPDPADIFEFDDNGDITGVKDEFKGGNGGGSDINPNRDSLKEILALAGNPTEADLKAWAERRTHDSEEIQPTDKRWWYGLLAKELGYTDTYHRPYTSVPADFERLAGKYDDIKWLDYYS